MKYPEIYLAVDNCFAGKRWTKPEEWCAVIADLGIACIEASADNELDPFYMGKEYLADWVPVVKRAAAACNVTIVNLYSGHGSYATLGLTHTDSRVRRRMIDEWFKPLICVASELDAGFGFFAHAFPHSVLQSATLYDAQVTSLEEALAEINHFAAATGCKKMGLEQMYSPHQYPWTIEQTTRLLTNVTEKSGASFYFTEDLGHHHIKFMRPDEASLKKICAARRVPPDIWLGSDKAFLFAEEGDYESVKAEMDATPHLFSTVQDGDCYAWLSELGAYSPIIHLQQTDGKTSAHLPFTTEKNQWGIIEGGKVLQKLKESYDSAENAALPPRCDKIYLTLELFTGTAAIVRDVMDDYRESVAYWRAFIPHDGMTLDKLVQKLKSLS